MRVLITKRLIKLCCYLLTASIALSPVVHASYMSSMSESSGHIVQETHSDHIPDEFKEVSENCHHQEFDVKDALESCDHDSDLSCKILCAVSISPILTMPIDGVLSSRPSKWPVETATQRIQTSFLSVFKPPRA